MHDVLTDVAQGFTRGYVFQAHHCGDVASQNFLDFSTVVGVHLQDTANTLFLALDRVVDRFTGVQNTRVNAHEGQLTYERIAHELECQSRELGAIISRQADGVAVVVHAFDWRDIDGRRQVIKNGVEHALHRSEENPYEL